MSIIIRPSLTQKSMAQQEKGRFSLIVKKSANKLEIAREVSRLFNATVVGVRTARYHGKKKARFLKGRWVSGQRSAYKKAIVTVRAGENIAWQ